MKELILSIIVIVFIANVGRANGVEFEIPMFSKKVIEQGSDKEKSDEECIETRDENGDRRMTCSSTVYNTNAPKDTSVQLESSDVADSTTYQLNRQGQAKQRRR